MIDENCIAVGNINTQRILAKPILSRPDPTYQKPT